MMTFQFIVFGKKPTLGKSSDIKRILKRPTKNVRTYTQTHARPYANKHISQINYNKNTLIDTPWKA